MNVKVTCIFLKKYDSQCCLLCMYGIFAKNISKSSPKVGNCASVGFYFSGRTTSKENSHFI